MRRTSLVLRRCIRSGPARARVPCSRQTVVEQRHWPVMDGVPWLGDDPASWWATVAAWVQAQTQRLGLGPATIVMEGARTCSWGVTVPVEAGSLRLFFKATEPKRPFEAQI